MRSIQHLKRLPSRFYSNTPRASRFLTSSSSTFIENEDFNYCLNQVKTYDYEGILKYFYLSTIYYNILQYFLNFEKITINF